MTEEDITLTHCTVPARAWKAISDPVWGYDPEARQQILNDADATAKRILELTGEKELLVMKINYDWFPYLPYLESDGEWLWHHSKLDEYFWGFCHQPLARELWEKMVRRRHENRRGSAQIKEKK